MAPPILLAVPNVSEGRDASTIDEIGDAFLAPGAASEPPATSVGAVDVVPLVYLDVGARGAACAEALVVADRIASDLDVPVFLYGELADDDPRSTRAELRRGGARGLAERLAAHSGASPDFGPPRLHRSA